MREISLFLFLFLLGEKINKKLVDIKIKINEKRHVCSYVRSMYLYIVHIPEVSIGLGVCKGGLGKQKILIRGPTNYSNQKMSLVKGGEDGD